MNVTQLHLLSSSNWKTSTNSQFSQKYNYTSLWRLVLNLMKYIVTKSFGWKFSSSCIQSKSRIFIQNWLTWVTFHLFQKEKYMNKPNINLIVSSQICLFPNLQNEVYMGFKLLKYLFPGQMPKFHPNGEQFFSNDRTEWKEAWWK
jgi:hypothetical protein